VVAIAAGEFHSLALKADGSVVAWGRNFHPVTTVPESAQTRVAAIAGGGQHALALKTDGTVVAWGLDSLGQVTGTPSMSWPYHATASPVILGNQVLSRVVAIEAGSAFNAVIVADPAGLPPMSTGFSATTPRDQPLTLSWGDLMAPIRDPEGYPVFLQAISRASQQGGVVQSNATAAVYIPSPGFVGTDQFEYVVNDLFGAQSTVTAQIAVLPAGTVANVIRAPTVTSGAANLTFSGLPGRTYGVERADSLDGPWVDVGIMSISADGSGGFVDNNAPPGAAFYRTYLLP
jgi:hypothetical protein